MFYDSNTESEFSAVNGYVYLQSATGSCWGGQGFTLEIKLSEDGGAMVSVCHHLMTQTIWLERADAKELITKIFSAVSRTEVSSGMRSRVGYYAKLDWKNTPLEGFAPVGRLEFNSFEIARSKAEELVCEGKDDEWTRQARDILKPEWHQKAIALYEIVVSFARQHGYLIDTRMRF